MSHSKNHAQKKIRRREPIPAGENILVVNQIPTPVMAPTEVVRMKNQRARWYASSLRRSFSSRIDLYSRRTKKIDPPTAQPWLIKTWTMPTTAIRNRPPIRGTSTMGKSKRDPPADCRFRGAREMSAYSSNRKCRPESIHESLSRSNMRFINYKRLFVMGQYPPPGDSKDFCAC